MGRHSLWRKEVKKLRRKRIRSTKAQARDERLRLEEEKRLQSPTYRSILMEQESAEKQMEEEEKRLSIENNKKWMEEEDRAQKAWNQFNLSLDAAKLEKLRKELILKAEWEKEEKKRLEKEAEKKRAEEEEAARQEALVKGMDDYLSGAREELPEYFSALIETHPGREECPFFTKTGACRFRAECSRNHIKPTTSEILLIPGFYSHFSMVNHYEYDTDISLEFDQSDTYSHFLDFYEDIVPEFEKFGRLTQVKVCCNYEPHLRGNVYVSYESRREAIKAFRSLHGRWYGGRVLNVEFVNIPSWRKAICGLFLSGRCPKGKACNFLHVFQNPSKDERKFTDRRHDVNKREHRENRENRNNSKQEKQDKQDNNKRRRGGKEWRWSESPEPEDRGRPRSSRRSSRDRKRKERRRSRDRKR